MIYDIDKSKVTINVINVSSMETPNPGVRRRKKTLYMFSTKGTTSLDHIENMNNLMNTEKLLDYLFFYGDNKIKDEVLLYNLEKIIENMYQKDRSYTERFALLGDTFLNAEISKVFIFQKSEIDVGQITEQKKKYISNFSMANFMSRIGRPDIEGIPKRGANLIHLKGTLFEALIGIVFCTELFYPSWEHPEGKYQLFDIFISKWMIFVDNYITKDNMKETSITDFNLFQRGNSLIIKSGNNKEIADLDILYGKKVIQQVVQIISNDVKFNIDKIQETYSIKYLKTLDAIPICPNDYQKRCIIVKKNRNFFRICHNCRTSIPLDVIDNEEISLVEINNHIDIHDYSPDRYTNKELIGLPLYCIECYGNIILVDQCSIKYRCEIGKCSKKYRCGKYSTWKCVNCGVGQYLRR